MSATLGSKVMWIDPASSSTTDYEFPCAPHISSNHKKFWDCIRIARHRSLHTSNHQEDSLGTLDYCRTF